MLTTALGAAYIVSKKEQKTSDEIVPIIASEQVYYATNRVRILTGTSDVIKGFSDIDNTLIEVICRCFGSILHITFELLTILQPNLGFVNVKMQKTKKNDINTVENIIPMERNSFRGSLMRSSGMDS